ncbi:MAG: hypothetical protein ACRCXT_17170 [Paraclostridium sp.]
MNEQIILHKNQQQFDDLINDYGDTNKYKCKTCSGLGSNKKFDYLCTNSLSDFHNQDVFKIDGCNFYKKESLEYDTEYEYGVLDLN